MVFRPRTKLKIARKTKRCPKCGVIVMTRKRCKTCHKPLV
jgi:ribosomal protein S27AE